MRIVLLPAPEDDVIAREDQLGNIEGEIFLGSEGVVYYRHEADPKCYFVNRDQDQFRRSVNAFDCYLNDVVRLSDEAGQLRVVEQFRDDLKCAGVDVGLPDDFWALIFEQVEAGLI